MFFAFVLSLSADAEPLVLEHLEPEPIKQFAPVVLGRLKPKVWIVATPNRDFTYFFGYVNKPGSARSMRNQFVRRFEWTRASFREWALRAAQRFGYDVEFCGVGGLGDHWKLSGYGARGFEVVATALRSPGAACPASRSSSAWEPLKGLVCPKPADDDTSAVASDFRRVFGDCSQIAVFVLRPDAEQAVADAVAKEVAAAPRGKLKVPTTFSRPSSCGGGGSSDYGEVADGIKLVSGIHAPDSMEE